MPWLKEDKDFSSCSHWGLEIDDALSVKWKGGFVAVERISMIYDNMFLITNTSIDNQTFFNKTKQNAERYLVYDSSYTVTLMVIFGFIMWTGKKQQNAYIETGQLFLYDIKA